MRNSILSAILAFALSATGCGRCPYQEVCSDEVLIPVKIDWGQSGIMPGGDAWAQDVHRVSIRFFPRDGSLPFDRYLEGDLFKGEIMVPVGSYSVVVYNEAFDETYWQNYIRFTDTDSYQRFAANLVAKDPQPYDFYPTQPGEAFVREPLKLASWNLDWFEVTPTMVGCSACLADRSNPINALTNVVMRALVTEVRVVVEVVNLSSATRMEGAWMGAAGRVYMASGKTHAQPFTHLFTFTSPQWSEPTQSHGQVERSFLAFGRQPQEASYGLHLGVRLRSGEAYRPVQPLLYNVTNQVTQQSGGNINIRVKLALPLVKGEVDVSGWDELEDIIQ